MGHWQPAVEGHWRLDIDLSAVLAAPTPWRLELRSLSSHDITPTGPDSKPSTGSATGSRTGSATGSATDSATGSATGSNSSSSRAARSHGLGGEVLSMWSAPATRRLEFVVTVVTR